MFTISNACIYDMDTLSKFTFLSNNKCIKIMFGIHFTLPWIRFINARHACARGLQQSLSVSVCLSVCLFVIYHSSASLRCVCKKLNLLAESSLYSIGFQLTDFAKSLLPRVIACFRFSTAKWSAICNPSTINQIGILLVHGLDKLASVMTITYDQLAQVKVVGRKGALNVCYCMQ